MKKRTRKALIGYSFIGLWIIGFVCFMLYPLINSIVYSFSTVNIKGQGIEIIFVGMNNFLAIFSSEEGFKFSEALLAFAWQLVLFVPIITVFSIIISILLNSKIKFRGFFRSIFFLPVIISSGPVINELISQGASGSSFMENYGVIELIKTSFTPFIADPLVSLFSQIIMVFWFSGVQILIFLAGLQKMDPSIYEASAIDGAGPWETFWKITLPSLKNLIFINVIYTIVTLATFSENGVINLIKSNMFNPLTGYGFASAIAWVYFLIVSIFLALSTLLFRNKSKRIY